MLFWKCLLLVALADAAAISRYPRQKRDTKGFTDPATISPEDPAFGVLVSAGSNPLPRIEESPSTHYQQYGSKRIKVRYGPYKMPGNMDGPEGLKMEHMGGIVYNVADKVPLPCENCYISYMSAGLEDLSGKTVNTDTGKWLHHMLAIRKSPEAYDPTCAGKESLPHMAFAWDAAESERFFSSGNERTPANFSQSGAQAGYHIASGDEIGLIVDLMNTNPESHTVYVTLTWEYIPDSTPNFRRVRPVWLDAAQCGLSDVDPPKDKSTFVLTTEPWKVNKQGAGKLIGSIVHLHDGGTEGQIKINSKVVCSSSSKYATTKGYISPPVKMMGNQTLSRTMSLDNKHISEQDVCFNAGDLKEGDTLALDGFYDFTKRSPMINMLGQPAHLMAVGLLYVALPA